MIIFFFLLSLLITKLLNPTFYASIINLSLNKFFSLRTFEISSKFSLSLSFFSLKGISRSRETCNVKYKNHEMGEKGGKFPGNRSGNSHDNRAPWQFLPRSRRETWHLYRVHDNYSIARVTSTMSGDSIDGEDIFVANFFDVESTSPVDDVSNRPVDRFHY